jgi:hypothetical protein
MMRTPTTCAQCAYNVALPRAPFTSIAGLNVVVIVSIVVSVDLVFIVVIVIVVGFYLARWRPDRRTCFGGVP